DGRVGSFGLEEMDRDLGRSLIHRNHRRPCGEPHLLAHRRARAEMPRTPGGALALEERVAPLEGMFLPFQVIAAPGPDLALPGTGGAQDAQAVGREHLD